MVIDLKVIKDSIRIKCDPIIPSNFKYRLLQNLREMYLLETDGKAYLGIDKNSKLSIKEKNEYLKFYQQNKFNYSFEEFLELVLFPVGTLELFSKKTNEKIAYIDFIPDGDVNIIWIDVYNKNSKDTLLDLIGSLI